MLTQTLGLVVGSVSSSVETAVPKFVPLNILSLVFAGFLLSLKDLTKDGQYVLYPFWYVSFYRYPFQLMCTEEFRDGRFRACRGRDCPFSRFGENDARVKRCVVPEDYLDIDIQAAADYYVWVQLGYIAALAIAAHVLIKKVTLAV